MRCLLEEKAVKANHGAPNHGVYIESVVEMTIMGDTYWIKHLLLGQKLYIISD